MADKADGSDLKSETKENVKDAKSDNAAEDSSKDDTKNGEKEEDDESSDGEEHAGLYDKPVVIEGKRERKTTVFLANQAPPAISHQPKPLLFEGKGESLGAMERTNYELGRCAAVELKPLHKLLYGRDGRATEIKKNIRKFNGFAFEKDSKEYEAKKLGLDRFTNDELKRLCEIFDLEKKGIRNDLLEKVMAFLMLPKSSGRPAPQPKPKKADKKKRKRTEKDTEKSKKSKGKGKGESLGAMERTNYELGRCAAVELKPLHKLLYGRDGRATEIKKNIRKFNGFAFEKDSKEYEAKKLGLDRFTNDGLKRLCEIFDLEKKGIRNDLLEKVMAFLMLPKSSGRPAPQPKPKKADKKKRKRTEKDTEKSKKSKGKGKGESLGAMERTNYELGRCAAVELKPLHKLLYGRDGRATEIKKNIRKFNGFAFEKDSKEYEAKKLGLDRFTNDGLKRLCEIFDLEKKGIRNDLLEKVMAFLMLPKSSGRPAPQPKPKKADKKKRKRTEKDTEKSKKSKGKLI